MTATDYTALHVVENADGGVTRQITELPLAGLPEHEVLIRVQYSSLNYKDALSATGNRGVTRNYPHTPGIDAAGSVVSGGGFAPGEQVLVTGYDLGMNTPGGFGQYIRVPQDWVVRLPESLSLAESMALGTAGFTAGLSLHRLLTTGVKPADGEVLVTGATGGVGSITVALLHRLGYQVVAATGKPDAAELLRGLGASRVIDRQELAHTDRPMLKPLWAGVIDTVAGDSLATAIKATAYGGCVTTCGNVGGDKFTSSVYPFILRGVSLHGIDSAQCPMPTRLEIWRLLATDWRVSFDPEHVREVPLAELSDQIDEMLAGRHVGRTVVNLG